MMNLSLSYNTRRGTHFSDVTTKFFLKYVEISYLAFTCMQL